MEVRPGYKQTEVGVIPEEWELKQLRDLAEIRSGVTKNSKVSVNDPLLVNYLRVANVQDGFLDLSNISKIEINRSDLKRYAVLLGDVLMNEGGDLDKLGRGSIWLGEFHPCVHQNHVFVVRCDSRLFPQYLNTWTGSRAARRYFMVAGKQTTNLASINKTALGELPVAMPPGTEQRAIAAAMDDVDALLAALGKLIAKKRDLKQAAMQQLLTGKLRLPGFSGEWQMTRFDEVCEKIQDGTHFSPKFGGNDYLYVTSKNIRFGTLDISTAERISAAEHAKIYGRCDVRRGDLLLTKDGANTGNAALNTLGEPFSLLSSVALLRFDHRRYSPAFFLYQILSTYGQEQIKEMMSGNAITRLTLVKIRALRFAVASFEEQVAIAAILTDMDTEIAALEQRLAKTRDIKQAMMQELLTGRTRLVSPQEAHA